MKKYSVQIFWLALVFLLCSCEEQIVHDLSELEANKIAVRLHDRAIRPEKIRQPDGRWAISVSSDKALSAIKVLSDTRHFRQSTQHEGRSSSVISSRDDQRFQYERSLSHEIESTLRSLEGVLDVRVHLKLPAVDPLFGRPVQGAGVGSGSVLIVTSDQNQVTKDEVAALVSGASGVPPKLVSVLIHHAQDGVPRAVDASEQSLHALSETSKADSFSYSSYSMKMGFSVLLILIGAGILGLGLLRKSPSTQFPMGQDS